MSVTHRVVSAAVEAADKVSGWMSRAELEWLASTAAGMPVGAIVVELGSWKGRSTKAIACALPEGARLYAIDHWEGTENERLTSQYEALQLGPDVMFETFARNLEGEIRVGKVCPLRRSSEDGFDAVRACAAGEVDWVFLDGDHRYEATKRDIQLYRKLLKPGGIVSGHDYVAGYPGVMRAVDEEVGKVNFAGTIWWAR